MCMYMPIAGCKEHGLSRLRSHMCDLVSPTKQVNKYYKIQIIRTYHHIQISLSFSIITLLTIIDEVGRTYTSGGC